MGTVEGGATGDITFDENGNRHNPHSAHLLSHKRLWLGTLRKLSGQTNELITGLQDIIST